MPLVSVDLRGRGISASGQPGLHNEILKMGEEEARDIYG